MVILACLIFLANAAQKEIVPYFGEIIEQLKLFLAPAQNEDQQKVQMQALGSYLQLT